MRTIVARRPNQRSRQSDAAGTEQDNASDLHDSVHLDAPPFGINLERECRNDVLRGRVVDEREYRELAEQLSCSEQLVRQNVSRGLRRLRADLKEAPDDRLHH